METNVTKSEYEVNHMIELSPQVLADYDVIVPDYRPDLLKILQVDANAVVQQFEVQNDRITVTGKVDYKILYIPDSATGITGIITSAPFHHIEETSAARQDMLCHVQSDVEHVEFSMVNSRKIGIKTVIGLNIHLTDTQKISAVTAVEGDDMELKTRSFRTAHRVVDRTCTFSVSDTLAVPVGQPSIQSLIKSDVAIRGKDVKIISNKVVTKGELVVCTLYSAENDAMPVCTVHEIPFTEILDAEGIDETQNTHVAFALQSAEFKESTDADGELRNILADIKLCVQINADEMTETEAVYDAYSTQSDLKLTTACVEIQEVQDAVSGESTVKSVLSFPAELPPPVQVYNVVAKPYVNSAAVQGGRVVVDGSIDAYVLYLSDRQDNLLSTYQEEIPFRAELDCAAGDTECNVKALCDITHVSYNLNASGEVETRVIVRTDATVSSTEHADIITEIEAVPLQNTDDSSIVLYYVQNNDSLWEIAKRYHTKIDKICGANHLEENAPLSPGMQLLIPKTH